MKRFTRLGRSPQVLMAYLVLLGLLSISSWAQELSQDKTPGAYSLHFPYEVSREVFRDWARALAQQGERVETQVFPVPSQKKEDLTVDTLYLPATKEPQHLFILISGSHGAEASVGAGLQFLFLEKVLPQLKRDKLSLLLIHSLNPWGHKHQRRVTENNVDLNRNFVIDPASFQVFNQSYENLNSFLNPQAPLRIAHWWNEYDAVALAAYYLARYSMKDLRSAILEGQYHRPEGIYFGGQDYEPQRSIVDRILKRYASSHNYLFFIDLHTGFGERGKLHFYGLDELEGENLKLFEKVFSGIQVDTGSDDDFYETHGDLTAYVESLLREDQVYLPMSFEFGTLNSESTWGSIESLLRIRHENQGYHHGHHSPSDEQKIQRKFKEMFAPTEREWGEQVISQFLTMTPLLLERFIAYPRSSQ